MSPTSIPTLAPSGSPSIAPTKVPTGTPSFAPSAIPTSPPSAIPTASPTIPPTASPSAAPTIAPTASPTILPTAVPSAPPTIAPTASPTAPPTAIPTAAPTSPPTSPPTTLPTASPTSPPTIAPTSIPTSIPTTAPTGVPSVSPTAPPTRSPTAAPTSTPTVAPTPTPLLCMTFLTNVSYTGNLGGVAGADAICQAASTGPGVAPAISQAGSANWVAWISDGSSDVANRMLHSRVPFVDASNATIALNWYDLVYSLRTIPTLNQYGQTIDSSDDYMIWSATWALGLPGLGRNNDVNGGSPLVSCNNWTSANGSVSGGFGLPPYDGGDGILNAPWSHFATSMCSSSFHLMCVQSNCPAVVLPTNGQCIAFILNNTYDGDLGGFKGADDLCNAAAASPGANTNVSAWASSYRAWLGGSTSSPSFGFDRSGVPYRLAGGTILAPNWDGLINLLNPLNINQFGTVRTAANEAWSSVLANTTQDLGTPSTPAASCLEWTNDESDNVGSTGEPSITGTGGRWSFDVPQDQCDEFHEFYCFQQGCQP